MKISIAILSLLLSFSFSSPCLESCEDEMTTFDCLDGNDHDEKSTNNCSSDCICYCCASYAKINLFKKLIMPVGIDFVYKVEIDEAPFMAIDNIWRPPKS